MLADWIVDLAESSHYIAQTTSVPGVAQRTGATIYYVELFPRGQAEADNGRPVLALMPLPGDVDIVLASELMEAGRAVQRGLVTADRTTLIASTHRIYSMAEKSAMADGRSDVRNLIAHGDAAAKRFVRFDMAQVAEESGSVLSAVLFGALAGAGVLPFAREDFQRTIERGGLGVKASLKAFAIGFDRAGQRMRSTPMDEPEPMRPAAVASHPKVRELLHRVETDFPKGVRPILVEGMRRLVDYQDPAYAALYLDRIAQLQRNPHSDEMLITEAARHLALWMSYEDTIRVADLKTRQTRFERVRSEVKAQVTQVVAINEFMHPRVEEVCETLPAALGKWLARSGWPRRALGRLTSHGRVINTSSITGFLLLYLLAGMRRWRRGTLRYAVEDARIQQWLQRIEAAVEFNPQLALEMVLCQRLVKGYGDTHERGWRNFQTVMAFAETAGNALAASTLRDLREAALADDSDLRLRTLIERQGESAPPQTTVARAGT